MLDTQTKRRVCKVVAGLVAADRQVHELEEEFFDDLTEALGLDPEEDLLLPPLSVEEATAEARGLSGDVREAMLDLLVEMAAADGKVAEGERSYLDAVAKALELPEGDMDARLAARCDAER